MFARFSKPALAVTALLLAAMLLSASYVRSVVAAPLSQAGDPARTITVVGRGEVTAAPDVARTNIGVEALAPTVAEAMEDAEARMTAIKGALLELGIDPKDMQTSNFSINFERQMPEPVQPAGESRTPAGVYRVSNMLEVTIRDMDQVGNVIEATVNAGANNIWGVSFGLDNTDELEVNARERAVADARARAESLAGLTGVTLGRVVAVSEVIDSGAGPVMMEAAAMGRGFGGGGTPVEPGELTFATRIQVIYAIEQ